MWSFIRAVVDWNPNPGTQELHLLSQQAKAAFTIIGSRYDEEQKEADMLESVLQYTFDERVSSRQAQHNAYNFATNW
jgi:hypothetical protein